MIATQEALDAAVAGGATEVELTGHWPSLRLDGARGVRLSGNALLGALRLTDCVGMTLDGLRLHYAPQTGDPADRRPFRLLRCAELVLIDVSATGELASGRQESGLQLASAWWGIGPEIEQCTDLLIDGLIVRHLRRGLHLIDCRHFVVRGSKLGLTGSDNLRIAGCQDGLIEANAFFGADPAPEENGDDNTGHHHDNVQAFHGQVQPRRPARIVLRRNWLAKGPRERASNSILFQAPGAPGPIEGIVLQENVIVARGENAALVNAPAGCIYRRNTVIRDGDGAKLKLPAPGSGNIAEGNVVPSPMWFDPAAGVTETGTVVVPPEAYAAALSRPDPLDVTTWRAVPGGPLDGVGSPLLWPDRPAPGPDVAGALAALNRAQSEIDTARTLLGGTT